MSKLGSLFADWRAAEAPRVDVTRVEWPELERVLRAAAALRPFVDTSSAAASAIAGTLAARRVVTSTPLPPSHTLTDLTAVIDGVDVFMAERPDHALCEPLRPLAAALRGFAAAESPVAARVADLLCEYGETPDGRPEAVLVVPRRTWTDPVRAWLVGEGFDCVGVASPADLRSCPASHAAVVMLGHPASTFSSPFRAFDVTARETGWLLTAPTAPRVRLVLTTDAPSIREDALWLLPAPSHPTLGVLDDGPQRSDPAPHDWLHARETRAALARWTPRPAAGSSEDETLAVEVQLASAHAVFFHREVGPRPYVVAVDDETGAVALSTAPLPAVAPGAVVAVRVGTAPHEQVVTRADAWLQRRRRWSPKKIIEVRGFAAALKAALRRALDTTGHGALHKQLTRTLTDEYARALLRNPLDEQYIAPQRRAGFDALVAAIGAHSIADRFDDLAMVRTAHHQAGEEIRRELLTLLRDRQWVADVDEDGWAVLHAGELGGLLLAVVTARLDEPVPIARTWLGQLIDCGGRRVTTLPAKEGTT